MWFADTVIKSIAANMGLTGSPKLTLLLLGYYTIPCICMSCQILESYEEMTCPLYFYHKT